MALCTVVVLSLLFPALAQENSRYQIQLRSRTFVPEPGLEANVESMAARLVERERMAHVFVQFNTLPSAGKRKQLEAVGIRLLRYVGGNTYTASVLWHGVHARARRERHTLDWQNSEKRQAAKGTARQVVWRVGYAN